jgi:putative transposase
LLVRSSPGQRRQARAHWYNVEHRHSGISYVSPEQRHAGQDLTILQARHALYQQARQTNPARWSGRTRNWDHIAVVASNPEKKAATAAVAEKQKAV